MATPETSPRDAILIVDDEPDIHAVTKLSLKALKRRDRRLEVSVAEVGTSRSFAAASPSSGTGCR